MTLTLLVMILLSRRYKCVKKKESNWNNTRKIRTINKSRESKEINNDLYLFSKSNLYILKVSTKFILFNNASIFNNLRFTKYLMFMTKIIS